MTGVDYLFISGNYNLGLDSIDDGFNIFSIFSSYLSSFIPYLVQLFINTLTIP